MEKFSLFDFMSFVLPGGTFLIVTYLILSGQNIQWFPVCMPDINVIAIPFLVVAYLAGHLLSNLGKKIEKKLPGMKTPWTCYLVNNPDEAAAINAKCNSLFNKGILKGDGKMVDTNKSGKCYDRIYDYLEVQEKDAKIKILMSQYGFFRNLTAVWFSLFFVFALLYVLHLCKAIGLNSPVYALAIYSIITLLLCFASARLMKQRILLTMAFVYRTFLAINIG